MTAEGYRSSPLSDGLENRIRERLTSERQEGRQNAQMGREHMAAISDGRISALEWVLREAESIKMEALTAPKAPKVMGEFVIVDHVCPDCHHEHEGRNECSHYLGEEKFCHCESKVTA
jgi:hypothetical protein